VAGTVSFANGDGLCFINADHELEGFRVNRVQGNRLFPHQMPSNLKAGMALYRNYDQEFERQLARPTAERKIPISMYLSTTEDGFSLSCNDVSVSVVCEHQTANKPQHENIRRQLSKLGDTIYECKEVTFAPEFNFFIPNSVLSELRRQLMERLAHAFCGKKAGHAILNGFDTESVANGYAAAVPAPHYPHAYLYNIANRLSRDFYQAKELTAYEIKGGEGPVMQCRHCLRYALGHCLKNHPNQLKEPLSLRLGDGRLFRLEFDCKNCQMNVYAGFALNAK
jgi:putative protease